MNNFEKEQLEILKLTDEVRHDQNINKWEKHSRYVDIVKNFLERYIPSNLQLVKYSHIEGLPEQKYHLIMIRKDAKSKTQEKIPRYDLKSVAAIIEIRGSSLVSLASYEGKFEEDIKTRKTLSKQTAGRHSNIKWLYLALREREKTKREYVCNYVKLCKERLGQDFFYLRETTTKKTIQGEWKRFVKALLDP